MDPIASQRFLISSASLFRCSFFFCSNFNLRLCALCAPPALKADYVGAKNNAPATVKEITLLIQSADLILKSRLASCFAAAGCMMFFPLRISGAQKREPLIKALLSWCALVDEERDIMKI
jgi:hypothetical protein